MTARKGGLTISQVAAAAGVARSSVSRAYTRPDMLSPETVKRIMDAADRLGYVPNHTARALSTGRHGNIALIVPDIANPFFPPLIRAAQIEAERSDLCVFLGNTDENPRQEDKLLARFIGQVEGLILVSSRLPEERIRAHAERRPLVLVNRDVKGIPRVLIDSASGVRDAVAHLAELGHKKLIYVSGPTNSWANKQRRDAARRTTAKFGLGFDVVAAPVPTFEAGRLAADAILATGATAVVAFDDLLAQGVLAGLSERGIQVPQQFGIIGCDDVLAAVYSQLTTVSTHSIEAGQLALSLLVETLQTRSIQDVHYVLGTSLIVRSTTLGYTGSDRAKL